MKSMRNLVLICVAVLSVAAVVYFVIRHFDDVMRPVHVLLRRLGIEHDICCGCEDEIFEVTSED